MGGGADIFLNWLSSQTKAHPVLQRAHVPKGYFYPLFVIPCQIFIQYVNEFLDAYSCPVPVVKHLVFHTAKQPFAGGIVRGASLFLTWNAPIRLSPCGLSSQASGSGIPCQNGRRDAPPPLTVRSRHPACHSPGQHPVSC